MKIKMCFLTSTLAAFILVANLTAYTPSPYEIGRSVGDSMGNIGQRYKDNTAIEDILTKASRTDNPREIERLMMQALTRVSPERQGPVLSILERKLDEIHKRSKNR